MEQRIYTRLGDGNGKNVKKCPLKKVESPVARSETDRSLKQIVETKTTLSRAVLLHYSCCIKIATPKSEFAWVGEVLG